MLRNTEDGRELNLQLFAEEAGAAQDGQDAGEAGGKAEEGKTQGQKMLTQEEVDQLIERRLAREKRDQEKRIKEAREAGEKSGEERARMSEADRMKADRERAEAEAGEREAALRRREAEITRRELRAEAVDQLIAKGLPKELSDLIDYTDADACKASMATVEKVFRQAVQAGIDERIRASGGSVGAGSGAKPDMDKLSDADYYSTIYKKK